mgnify:FL=1
MFLETMRQLVEVISLKRIGLSSCRSTTFHVNSVKHRTNTRIGMSTFNRKLLLFGEHNEANNCNISASLIHSFGIYSFAQTYSHNVLHNLVHEGTLQYKQPT